LNNAKQMELAAQAVYALRKCQFSYGKHVLVTGCDPLSIMIGAVAKADYQRKLITGDDLMQIVKI
jgi:hypothetical protein